MPLSPAEISACREAFSKFDKDGSGSIDAAKLKAMLASMGQQPTDEELFLMISQVDEDNSGEIEFGEFLQVFESQQEAMAKLSDETDTIEAFVALGGNADKSGSISAEKLSRLCKEFGLTLDIDAFIRDTDTDKNGLIEYPEFKAMLHRKSKSG